ncbi:MAG: hypothetical protein ABIQ16_24605, partial [Polyangiaceae bacterium]
ESGSSRGAVGSAFSRIDPSALVLGLALDGCSFQLKPCAGVAIGARYGIQVGLGAEATAAKTSVNCSNRVGPCLCSAGR